MNTVVMNILFDSMHSYVLVVPAACTIQYFSLIKARYVKNYFKIIFLQYHTSMVYPLALISMTFSPLFISIILQVMSEYCNLNFEIFIPKYEHKLPQYY